MSELSASILLTLRDEVSQRTKAIVARIAELEQQVKQGGDVGAAAALELRNEFEALTASTRESEQISRRFAQAQRVLGAANEGAAAATGATTRAQQQAGSAISFVSKESKNQGREIGGLVNVFAELGYSVGSAIPGMQQTGTQLAIMGGTAYQLGAAFGVFGAGIGVVSGLLPTLISSFAGASREARNLKRDIDETNEAYDTLLSQIRRRRQAEEEQQAIWEGRADIETQRAAVAASREQEKRARAELVPEIREAVERQSVSIGPTLRDALAGAFANSPAASVEEILGTSGIQDALDRVASERAGQTGNDAATELSSLRERLEFAARNVSNFRAADGTTLLLRAASLGQTQGQREAAEEGLRIAERREAERRRRASTSESVDIRLAGAGADLAAAQGGLLDLVGDTRLGRRTQQRIEQRIRDGSVTERDARRVGGDEGLALLDALRSATREQEELQAERARIDAEERERRLAEIAATERAASAMERAAEAMERAGASGAATPARQRPAYGQGAELGGAS